MDEFRVVKHTRTRKIYEIYTDRITAAPLASPVPCAAWGPEAGRWAAPQALQRRPLPERMLLGDPWCWWLALPTQSYSSAGRSAISILFPFRNRACKIFFLIFFFSHFSSLGIYSPPPFSRDSARSFWAHSELHCLWEVAAVDPCSEGLCLFSEMQ